MNELIERLEGLVASTELRQGIEILERALTELRNELEPLVVETADIPAAVDACSVGNDAEATYWTEYVQETAEPAVRAIESAIGPYAAAANLVHKSLTGLRGVLTKAPDEAVAAIKARIAEYLREQQRRAREAQRKADDERRHLEDEARKKARTEGRPVSEELNLLPPVKPEVVAPRMPDGASLRTPWHAELDDEAGGIHRLCQTIAEKPEFAELVKLDVTQANKMARALREKLSAVVPGLRGVEDAMLAKTRR